MPEKRAGDDCEPCKGQSFCEVKMQRLGQHGEEIHKRTRKRYMIGPLVVPSAFGDLRAGGPVKSGEGAGLKDLELCPVHRVLCDGRAVWTLHSAFPHRENPSQSPASAGILPPPRRGKVCAC